VCAIDHTETLSGETVKIKGQWNRALPMMLAIGMAGTGVVHAQDLVGGRPEVEVDNSVLDQLGPAATLPGLFLDETPSAGVTKITLIPPKSLRARAGKTIKTHHHLVVTGPTNCEPGTIHLHPIRHHVRKHHHARPKAVKQAVPAATREEVPAPVPTPAPAPAKSSPVSLTPAAPAPMAAPSPAPVQPPTQVPTPTPVPPAAAVPAPSAAPAAGTGPVALTAQQPTAPDSTLAATQETLSTITFDKDSARLPDGARDMLAHLASRMSEDATLEVQLLAYAAGDEENASKARRLSLSRALAVRSFLIDQGVRSTRIEVRALGNKVPDGSPDRVDIIGQKRG